MAYQNVATSDRDHESSTEASDSLMSEDEKPWDDVDLEDARGRRSAGLAAVLATLRHHRWLIDTVLLVSILALLLLLHAGRHIHADRQLGGDYTGAGPHFPLRVVHWESDPSFTPSEPDAFGSEETLARWNTLMPNGGGQLPVNQTTFFTTSLAHQIHCVFTMGRIFSAVDAGHTMALPDDYPTHFFHCLDYMRQAAMCAGDVTLEAHDPSDGHDNGPQDGGWSGHHVCKDYGAVINYLEDQIRDGVRTVLPIDN